MDQANNQNINTFTLEHVFIIIRNVLRNITLCILLGILCGFSADLYKTYVVKDIYTTSGQYSLQTSASSTSNSLTDSSSKAELLSSILNSNVIKEKIAQKTGIENFNGTIGCYYMQDTNIVSISVNCNRAKDSYEGFNALIESYNEITNYVIGDTTLVELQGPVIPTIPSNYNNHNVTFIKFFIIGCILGAGILVFNSYLSNTVKTKDDFNKIDTRLYSTIPFEIKKRKKGTKFEKNRSGILITNRTTSFFYIEAIKKLANKLEESCKKHGYKTIMFTSSLENEGKSSVAVNTALALAKKDKKVLLIDGDLRKPSLYKLLDIKGDYDLLKELDGSVKIQDKFYQQIGKLTVLVNTVPSRDTDHIDLLMSHIKDLDYYDYVIIDTCPSRHLNDSLTIASQCDAVMMVIKQNYPTTTVINDTIERIISSNGNIIGGVFVKDIINLNNTFNSYGYGYGYGYGHSKERR